LINDDVLFDFNNELKILIIFHNYVLFNDMLFLNYLFRFI